MLASNVAVGIIKLTQILCDLGQNRKAVHNLGAQFYVSSRSISGRKRENE